jgi:hypothetical protein
MPAEMGGIDQKNFADLHRVHTGGLIAAYALKPWIAGGRMDVAQGFS